MIEDVYSKILENIDVTAMDKFKMLLRKSITVAIIPENDPKPYIETLSFRFGQMLEGLESLANSKGKDKTLIVGTQMLAAIFNGLELNVDDSECFLLFHLRKLGRFRKRESELLTELKKQWKEYPDYELSDGDFSKALKSLMREKLILYRKGNIQLNTSFVIRYRLD